MDRSLVIARAYGGNPLKRVAIEQGHGLVYIVDPERVKAVEAGETSAIGFPSRDVFTFDYNVFREMTAQWKRRGKVDDKMWKQLRHFHNGN